MNRGAANDSWSRLWNMHCIGRRHHQWDRAVYTDYDARVRVCIVCGINGRWWSMGSDRSMHAWWRCDCDYCHEAELREVAWREQAPIRAALKKDEQEVLALYGRDQSKLWTSYMFKYTTPAKARKEFPEWQAERQAKQELRRQRQMLRQGHRTLTAIRLHLRGVDRLQPLESAPETTSQTS